VVEFVVCDDETARSELWMRMRGSLICDRGECGEDGDDMWCEFRNKYYCARIRALVDVCEEWLSTTKTTIARDSDIEEEEEKEKAHAQLAVVVVATSDESDDDENAARVTRQLRTVWSSARAQKAVVRLALVISKKNAIEPHWDSSGNRSHGDNHDECDSFSYQTEAVLDSTPDHVRRVCAAFEADCVAVAPDTVRIATAYARSVLEAHDWTRVARRTQRIQATERLFLLDLDDDDDDDQNESDGGSDSQHDPNHQHQRQ